MDVQKTISPIDGSVIVTRPLATRAQVAQTLERARTAQRAFRRMPLAERAALCTRMVDAFVAKGPEIAQEITLQMGRPSRHAPSEIRGFEERARTMIALAERGLAHLVLPEKPGFRRYIAREPLGVVFVVAPWNYPYLTAVNAIVPWIPP